VSQKIPWLRQTNARASNKTEFERIENLKVCRYKKNMKNLAQQRLDLRNGAKTWT
jgi:hypothetical protein